MQSLWKYRFVVWLQYIPGDFICHRDPAVIGIHMQSSGLIKVKQGCFGLSAGLFSPESTLMSVSEIMPVSFHVMTVYV